MAIDTSKLAEGFSTFATDFGQFSTDLGNFLKNLPAPDTTTQAAIDGFTTQLAGFDDQIKTMDASLNPAPPPPPPTGSL